MAGDAGDAGEEARKAAVMKPGVGGVFVRMACSDEGLDGSYIIYNNRGHTTNTLLQIPTAFGCWLLDVVDCV